MHRTRRAAGRLAAGLLIAWTAAASTAPAVAQEAWPARPIRVIVPYPAGGTTDQLARAVQKPLQEFLGQPVVVENKAGAGGTIGTEQVVRAVADGYTLLFGNSGPNAIVPLLRKIPYDPERDLRPVSTVAITPMILAVPVESPARTLKEFVALAKAAPNWNYGSVGNGSLSHLTGESFNALAGTKLTHVAYNGGAPMMTAFASGDLHMAFVTGLDGATMHQAGRVRYLAVATPQRSNVVPGLPAVAEEVPGFRSQAWFGLLAPKGVPDAIVARLQSAVAHAVSRAEFRRLCEDRQIEARSGSPDELEKLIRDEGAQWGALIRQAGIKVD